MIDKVIRIEHFYLGYKKNKLVLKDVDFEVKKAPLQLSQDRAERVKLPCVKL